MAGTRISPKIMNNIVIFAMLLMILLFNLDRFLPQPDAPQLRPLLPPDAYVLRIEQGQYKLERAGQGWRQSQLDAPVDITPATQLQAWQQGQLAPLDNVPEAVNQLAPLVVVVWLAGYNQGQVFAFYPTAEATFVKADQQWFRLKAVSLPTLLPWNSY